MKWINNLNEKMNEAADNHVRETYPGYKGNDLEGGTKDSFMDGAAWVIKNIESLLNSNEPGAVSSHEAEKGVCCSHCGDPIEVPLCRNCEIALQMPDEEY